MRERLGFTRPPLIRHANTVIRILTDADTARAASPFPFNRKKDYFADMRNTRIDEFPSVVALLPLSEFVSDVDDSVSCDILFFLSSR